ncbi:MAG: hypothetical protein BWZ08_02821 [candidate division BRC1 bacterium ADurb.BinA292]|nr:MAG: hypothetical protein BWZ08_02821 [candidate division BRC1 bacterium ADurb.BinA292]
MPDVQIAVRLGREARRDPSAVQPRAHVLGNPAPDEVQRRGGPVRAARGRRSPVLASFRRAVATAAAGWLAFAHPSLPLRKITMTRSLSSLPG